MGANPCGLGSGEVPDFAAAAGLACACVKAFSRKCFRGRITSRLPKVKVPDF